MKIAIFGREIATEKLDAFINFCELARELDIELLLYNALYEHIEQTKFQLIKGTGKFETLSKTDKIDFAISIGGDGTFLRTARLIGDLNIPIAGVNTGRLGFLADVPMDEMDVLLRKLKSGSFKIEKRSLLHLEDSYDEFEEAQYALNEIAILRRDTSSLIVINVYIDDVFLNAYWADGLIISTPTGSTAYNMSAGGPIIYPGSSNVVITPIAPHSLTVRPIVLPDNGTIKLIIESRSPNYLVSVDSRSTSFDTEHELTIRKADFELSVIQLDNHNFFDTLRTKLMWGNDKRNSN